MTRRIAPVDPFKGRCVFQYDDHVCLRGRKHEAHLFSDPAYEHDFEYADNRLNFCAACVRRMDVTPLFFICKRCLGKLPDDLRRSVLNASPEAQRGVRRTALEFLGAENVNDVRVPIKRVGARKVGEGCDCPPIWKLRTPNLLTGAEDEFCNKCGKYRLMPGRAL